MNYVSLAGIVAFLLGSVVASAGVASPFACQGVFSVGQEAPSAGSHHCMRELGLYWNHAGHLEVTSGRALVLVAQLDTRSVGAAGAAELEVLRAGSSWVTWQSPKLVVLFPRNSSASGEGWQRRLEVVRLTDGKRLFVLDQQVALSSNGLQREILQSAKCIYVPQ